VFKVNQVVVLKKARFWWYMVSWRSRSAPHVGHEKPFDHDGYSSVRGALCLKQLVAAWVPSCADVYLNTPTSYPCVSSSLAAALADDAGRRDTVDHQ
jgi:hypothetical protein